MGSINLTSTKLFCPHTQNTYAQRRAHRRKGYPKSMFRLLEGPSRPIFWSSGIHFGLFLKLAGVLKHSRGAPSASGSAPGRHLRVSRALRGLPGAPRDLQKPMNSLRKPRFSEKLALKRSPRAQATPGKHFGPLNTPRPSPPHAPPFIS